MTGSCQRLLVIGQSTALSAPPPEGVRAFAVYSPIDEIVSPAACADPHADCRSVDSTHQMMGMNVAVWGEIIKILGDLEGARLRLDLLIPAG